MKLDLLVFAAHPDDAELSCGGIIAKHVALGKKVGIIDLTRGELGTRGTPEQRFAEALAAGQVLGIYVRENLDMRDGFFANDEAHQLKVIEAIRKYQPQIVMANAIRDRHSDHGRAAQLVRDAAFLSGLQKIETRSDSHPQEAWRPPIVAHYIQDQWTDPNFIIDISGFLEKKMEAIKCYASQFYNPNSKEPQTYISAPEFLQSLEDRARIMGRMIGVEYGEGFTAERKVGLDHLFQLK